jgi:hypothetical protein
LQTLESDEGHFWNLLKNASTPAQVKRKIVLKLLSEESNWLELAHYSDLEQSDFDTLSSSHESELLCRLISNPSIPTSVANKVTKKLEAMLTGNPFPKDP